MIAKDVIGLVTEVLDSEDWKYRLEDDGNVIEVGFRDDRGKYLARIMVQECPPVLGVLLFLPMAIPEPRRSTAAEAVVRANYGLVLGNFDLDMSDGIVHFRSVMPIDEALPSHEQIRALVMAACVTFSRYVRAFCRIACCEDLSAVEAIAEVEMAAREKRSRSS